MNPRPGSLWIKCRMVCGRLCGIVNRNKARVRNATGHVDLRKFEPCENLHLTRMYRSGYIKIMDAVLHALSDETRRTILELLQPGTVTAGELAEGLPIARPGVSRHLRVLREAGLVESRHEAQWRVYALRPEPLAEVDAWLGPYRNLWEQRLDALHTEIARGKHDQRRTT